MINRIQTSSAQARLFIGLPAFNEEVALPRVLERIVLLPEELNARITVLVYNDGSTDRTAAIAKEWQARLPLVLLGTPQNKGLGCGLRALIEYALANGGGDDVLAVMDCDDTQDPAQLLKMVSILREGADVIVASRFATKSTVVGVPAWRRFTAFCAMALFKIIHPVDRIWDYTCGYRAYRISVLRAASARYDTDLIRERGFACQVELLLKLNSVQANFAEVPLQLRYDLKPTKSKMDPGANIRRQLYLLGRWRLRGFHNF